MNLSDNVKKSLENAFTLAVTNKHEMLTTEHILWGVLQLDDFRGMLKSFNVKEESLENLLMEHFKTHQTYRPQQNQPDMTINVNKLLQRSVIMAKDQNKDSVSLWLLLLNILKDTESSASYFLKICDIDEYKIKTYASHGSLQEKIPAGLSEDDSEKADNLNKFAVNLNKKARDNKIDELIGRHYEIERTAQILSRRHKNNPLLVGEPGVGKTAIAEGLAKLIVDGQVPDSLKDKEIYSLQMGALLAGTKYRGEFEQRIQNILEQVKNNPQIILFIDEIHTLIGAGSVSSNTMDASNIMKPALASGELRVIGATTFQEYREIFEKEKALDRRFQKVDVVEPTVQEAIEILKGLKKGLEAHHNVKYTKDAIESAVQLSVRYLSDRFLPDKAIDVLDEAGAAEHLKSSDKKHAFIDKKLIEETIARITKLPLQQISEQEKTNLENLETDLKSQVFGQDEAIETLSTSVCISKAGLNDEGKPLGSFLFAGPTGVGKTEIAKQLSHHLGIPLLRFDMSEYMEPHSIARLIGSPPGYVGHDKGGLLTDAVFKNQHSILLLDEIEKAHPDILNILLQVLDHGRLTDSNGRVVNFKNTFVILTTNAGASAIQKPTIGFLKQDTSSDGKKALNASFSPELRNRLDSIITFKSLSETEIVKIVDKNLNELQKMLKDKKIKLHIHADIKHELAKIGFDPLMGARPMARVIQDKIKKPLSRLMLFGDLKNGGTISITPSETTDWNWTTTPISVSNDTVTKAKKSKVIKV